MKAMIQGAMTMKKEDRLPEIHVIDMSEETIKRYKKLFKDASLMTYEEDLEGAVKKGITEQCFMS